MAKENQTSGQGLCPFSWIQITEARGCFGGKEQLVWKPQPCMAGDCKLWDSNKMDCGLITK